MMVRWQARAAAGALVAVGLTVVALLIDGGRIVADVGGRASDVLAPEATSWAAVRIDGRDVALSGSAPTETLRRLAIERVSRQFGVRSVDGDRISLLPEVIPYVVTLERAGGVLTIGGSAPSAPDRRRMVDSFTRSIPNLAYNDRLTLARGAPDRGFLEAVAALTPVLGDLSSGTVTLTDQQATIRGEALSNAAYDRLRGTPLAMPAGYRVADVDVIRPRADPFGVEVERTADSIRIAGDAPDRDTLEALVGAARTAAGPAARTLVGLDLASGAAPGFGAVAREAVGFLGLMETGTLRISGAAVTIAGAARTPEAYRVLEGQLATWAPAGFAVDWSLDRATVTPFTLSAVRAENQITVSGFAPDETVLGAIQTAAGRVAGLKGAVVELTLARGAPEGFADAATFAIGMLRHVSEGTATVSQGRISVTGLARTGADLLDLDAAASASAPPGYVVALAVTPPVARPYVWTMEKSNGDLSIAGSVPSEITRALIREIAEKVAGDGVVADRTTLAGGLPQGVALDQVATFAATQLSLLDAGTARFEDGVLSLSGRTSNGLAGGKVSKAFRTALPAGVAAGEFRLDAPPALQFRIERGLDALAIQGVVPAEATTETIRSQIDRAFGNVDAEIALEPAEDLPDGTERAIAVALRAASLLANGTVTLEGPVITVKGRAFTGVGATRLSSDIGAAVPKGFRLDTSVGVAPAGPAVPAAECQALFDDVLGRNTIYFETGSAAVSDESHGLVDRIAALAARCPDARLVIEGHTDSAGDPAANRTLSKARADAVAAILTSTGIDAARLSAEGFGADRPVADNGTPEGQARNRRIEIRVAAAPTQPAPEAAPPAVPDTPAPGGEAPAGDGTAGNAPAVEGPAVDGPAGNGTGETGTSP